MTQKKGKKGKSKEQKSDFLVPSFNALIKPDSENNGSVISKQEDQKLIQILPIPEQVVVVKESKYGRGNFWIQFALVICSIAMLFTVYILSSKQNEITNNTLQFQIQKTYSDSIIQHIKDSLTLAQTDSSLSLTRRSYMFAQQNYIEENRPFVFQECPILVTNLDVDYAYIPITNHGHTPAYRVRVAQLFVHHGYPKDDSFGAPYDPRTWPSPDSTNEKIFAPNSQDTEKVKMSEIYSDTSKPQRLYLMGKIFYVDYWKRHHFTTFAYTYHIISHSFIRFPKYERTDD
jgi:hypothetical protein